MNCGHRLAREGGEQKAEGGGQRSEGGERRAENGTRNTEHGTRNAEPTSDLSRYLPPELLAKLEAAHAGGRMAGERRIVTILFCDVKGSTAAAEQLDPEDWAEIINGAFEHMIRPIYRYEGTLARLMGDAILAFFGAPIAHEDDPQRAILAGLEIQGGIQGYAEDVKQRWGLELALRVGINTGLVVVGEVGSDLRMEYTALGDAINLAARMEQTAQPGTVQVAEDTYRLAAPLFEFEALGALEIKGKKEPAPAYRVLGRKVAPGRLRGLAGLQSPLVGRQTEIEAIKRAVAGLHQGRGHLIAVIGEAGMGKSRLVSDARDRWPGRWSESTGISFEANHPYLQFQQHLRALAGLTANDPPQAVREGIDRLVAALPVAARTAAESSLARLLAAEGKAEQAERDRADGDGEAFKRQLFAAMTAIWQGQAEAGPWVCLFDDLHWADAASVELLVHLLHLLESHPILFICVFRPDRAAPGWRLHEEARTTYSQHSTLLELRPLDEAESQTLVDNLLAMTSLPTELHRLIDQKADGNPFFVEETIRTLIDDGVIVRRSDGQGWQVREGADLSRIDVPESLQTLLIARIDRLEEQTRQTLQLAAVIGRRFFHRILALISEMAGELDRQLEALERADLILEAGRIPELEYLFRHSLTQEAAYNTILLRRRREFHRRVAQAIEQVFGDGLEEFWPLLAHHYYQASSGDTASSERALHFNTLAGDAAFRLFAVPAALAHYTVALELARKSASLPSDRLARLYIRAGRCLELESNYANASRLYEELEELALRRQDRRLELAAVMARAVALAVPTPFQNPETARILAGRALALARQLGDRETEARSQWTQMLLHMYSGDMPGAIPYGEQAAQLARELGLAGQLGSALQDLALAYAGAGRIQDASAALSEAQPLWREVGNVPMQAENLANTAYLHLLRAEFDASLRSAATSYELSRGIGNEWGQVNSRAFVALTFVELGEIDQALDILTTTLPVARKVGHPASTLNQVQLALLYDHLGATGRGLALLTELAASPILFGPFRPYALAALAELNLHQGDIGAAEAALAEAFQIGVAGTLLLIEFSAQRVAVKLALGRGDAGRALALAAEMAARLQATGANYFLPAVLHTQAQALLAAGDAVAGLATLHAAAAAARTTGARMSLWPILAELSKVESGDGEVTTELRRMIAAIAARIADPDLRHSFLAHSALQ